MNYWLHRISHHSEVSYDLLDKGYLTIGWIDIAKTDVIETINQGETAYREFAKKHDMSSIWNLWYFAKMKKGDIIVVPMYNKEFGIYEVVEEIKPIYDLASLEFKNSNGDRIRLTSDTFINESKNAEIDLGFYLKVKEINKTKRAFVDTKLISRMKMRQTNGNISDLKNEIENAKHVKDPKNIKGEIIKALSGTFIENTLFSQYTPDQIEVLVKQYFLKIGASDVIIPAKNDPDKVENSDVDVIATFNDLNTAFYVQVKHHENETGPWAVKQVSSYLEKYYYNSEDNFVNIPWVLTTGKFSQETKIEAEKNNIVLVDGEDFVKMLLNVGLSNIDVK